MKLGKETMKTTVKVSDSRINRNNNVSGYMEICTELVQAQGYDKTFTYDGNGYQMTYESFKTTAYKQNNKDVQIDITLDFINGEATITVDAPEKSKLDEDMEQWEARSNDEFGTILKEINDAASDYFYAEPDELGILTTPIRHYMILYALDGTRKAIAHTIYRILEDRDILEDEKVKVLVDKMMELAA